MHMDAIPSVYSSRQSLPSLSLSSSLPLAICISSSSSSSSFSSSPRTAAGRPKSTATHLESQHRNTVLEIASVIQAGGGARHAARVMIG